MPVFARDVVLGTSVSSATLTIAGLGLYSATVNGHPTSTAVLQPGPSDFTQSVEYRSYDVKGLLGVGTNRLGMELGTGIYDEVSLPGRYSKLTHIGGPLGFTARLDYTLSDGSTHTVDTSKDWWARPGGTLVSDWYGGEDYDARVAPDWQDVTASPLRSGSGWSPAVVANISPQVKLFAQTTPPVTAGAMVPASTTTQLANGDWVIDYGRYVTGQPRLTLAAPAGRVLRMYPAERLISGVPSQASATGNDANPIYDQYTFAGAGTETWQPRFTYHGFRYLRITGARDLPVTPAAFAAVPVKTELPGSGSFSSSSAMLNSVVSLTNTSIDANLQAIITDCPNREKLGWLEEQHLLFGLLSGRYDMSAYAPNLVRLMLEAQRSDGSMPEIAPESVRFWSPFDGDVNWGGALVMLPWALYRTYGDTQTLSSAYPGMTRYVRFLQSTAPDNLIHWGLGDWVTPAAGSSRDLTTSMGYYGVVTTMVKVATAVGRADDARTFSSLAAQIKTAINANYYRDGMYGSEQATNAMALVLGLAPDVTQVRGALIALMGAWGNHFNAGEIGMGYIFTALHDMGRDDLLWAAIGQSSTPGYAAFVNQNPPALPEYWSGMDGSGSLAHFMLGYPAQWAQSGLAGIEQADDSVGYQKLVIRPAVFTGPDSVTATRQTVRGAVTVRWTRVGTSAHVTVTVPAGAQASVVLPSGTFSAEAGTSSFDTGLGARSDYGSTPFYVPTGPITLLPWNGALWAWANGSPAHLTWAQWQATGFAGYRVGLPAGSRIAFAPYGAGLFAWTPDNAVHKLSYDEWAQFGFPAPVRVPVPVTGYTWTPSIWLTAQWSGDPATWTVSHLSYPDWIGLGAPYPVTNVVTAHSSVTQSAGSAAIHLTDPDGFTHWLTYDEWAHIGYPTPTRT